MRREGRVHVRVGSARSLVEAHEFSSLIHGDSFMWGTNGKLKIVGRAIKDTPLHSSLIRVWYMYQAIAAGF